jgi:magnesium chelatase family protein
LARASATISTSLSRPWTCLIATGVRCTGTPWRINADIPGAELRRSYQPAAEAIAPIARAVDLGEISARAAYHVIRVAWTLADLMGAARPDAEKCGQALAFQLGVTQ